MQVGLVVFGCILSEAGGDFAEHNDYVARIQELEEHVGALEHELGVLRGVNPRAQVTSAELT